MEIIFVEWKEVRAIGRAIFLIVSRLSSITVSIWIILFRKKKKLFIVTILSKMFVKSNCSGQIFLSSKNCLIRRNLD